MLRVNKINTHYEEIQALWDVTLNVGDEEIVVVLGANGAGKTTLVKTIMGLIEPTSGMINYAGSRIEGRDPHKISKLGIAYGPEGGGLFRDMTVKENLEMGSFHHFAWDRREQTLERVFRLYPRLEERKRALARTLSGGERQMLMLARALMSHPSMVIFDEPSVGMSPIIVEESFNTIRQMRDDGITVLLIEQNVTKSLEIADRGYVLANGRVVAEGKPDELTSSGIIDSAYLGV